MWGTDNTSFPGQVFREVMKQGYQENTLVKRRAWPLDDGETADLGNVTMPVLNMVAQYDHLSIPKSCAVLEALVPSEDFTNAVVPTGHLG